MRKPAAPCAHARMISGWGEGMEIWLERLALPYISDCIAFYRDDGSICLDNPGKSGMVGMDGMRHTMLGRYILSL